MEHIEDSITCDVPVRVAYNQWTQFESFPQFMEGVTRVRQLDDKRMHWEARIAGKRQEWSAEIQEQVPDKKISWRSTSGAENSGTVTFDDLGAARCRVTLRLFYDPEGFTENLGDALGIVKARVKGDLERFKDFIESRQSETGAWRGEIRGGEVEEKSTN
jgi:uncharacterized membrane protein